jgi:hypothetical protein
MENWMISNIELVGVDFSDTNLMGLDFSDLFVILDNFRHSNLANADFSKDQLRGSDFKGAIFENTSLAKSDWYNAFNLEKNQFDRISDKILKCPSPYTDPTFKPFIDEVNKHYGIQFESYPRNHQKQLEDQWHTYSAPGGLCEVAEKRP